ncbi:uncharacterized protein [Battus philenor]|uniref:uncharacterized protein isoform X2 n=1 Tax=Battus philenor TaxID=42288 RepID=UPI0035D08CA7
MTENTGRSRNVSFEQLKSIIDFMGQHIEFATGNCRSLEARHTSKRLWEELTKVLNSCRTGTKKTTDGWSKYWSDFKNKLKNKVSILTKRKRSGSISKKGIRPLTKLEKRALVILGPHFERKKTRKKIDCFNDDISNTLPPEVKLEAYQDNVFSEFCNDQSETSDRLLGLYPKWLIEVEKKRADAELIRAKAEEQRAGAAARIADAMVMQAEALKKISEASTTQADAITRIALVLENRGNQNDILTI